MSFSVIYLKNAVRTDQMAHTATGAKFGVEHQTVFDIFTFHTVTPVSFNESKTIVSSNPPLNINAIGLIYEDISRSTPLLEVKVVEPVKFSDIKAVVEVMVRK